MRPYVRERGRELSRHQYTNDRILDDQGVIEKRLTRRNGDLSFEDLIFASTIDNEYVIKPIDSWLQDNKGNLEAVIRMPKGVPLSEYGFNKPQVLDSKQIASIGRNLACALRALHLYDIVHRDLKPHNAVLVWRDNQPTAKLIDFGQMTSSNTLVTDHYGTWPYYAQYDRKRFESVKSHDNFALLNTIREVLAKNLLRKDDFSIDPAKQPTRVRQVIDYPTHTVGIEAVYGSVGLPLDEDLIILLDERSDSLYSRLTDAANSLFQGETVDLAKLFPSSCRLDLGYKASELSDVIKTAQNNAGRGIERDTETINARASFLAEKRPSLGKVSKFAQAMQNHNCSEMQSFPLCYYDRLENLKNIVQNGQKVLAELSRLQVDPISNLAGEEIRNYLLNPSPTLPWTVVPLELNDALSQATRQIIDELSNGKQAAKLENQPSDFPQLDIAVGSPVSPISIGKPIDDDFSKMLEEMMEE